MTAFLGKSWSSCSSSVLSKKGFMCCDVLSFPPGVRVCNLNLIASIPVLFYSLYSYFSFAYCG